MPTIVAHALVAATAGVVCRQPKRLIAWSVACSMLPDVDVGWYYLGVALDHPLGHRGFTHSLLFAALLAVVVARYALALRWRDPQFARCALFLFAVTASHGVLDALTQAWLGVEFFWPFDQTRYLFPWRPLVVSEFIETFFSARGLEIVVSEALWIGLPCAALLVLHRLRERARIRR